MVVTEIKPAKNSAGQHVYLEGEYAFTITDLEFSSGAIKVGQELTAEEVERFDRSHRVDKTYTRAVRFIGVRPRSIKETREYLVKHDLGDIDVVIERLEMAELLDDRAFAEAWVRDRMTLKPKSRFALKGELMQKGVAKQIINEVLEGSDEQEAIRRVIKKKQRGSRFIDVRKLTEYLLRQGFDYDLVKQVLETELVGGDEPIS